MKNFARQVQVFARGKKQQVANQLAVVRAGLRTGLQHPPHIEKQHLGRFRRNRIHHQRFTGAGIGFRKNLAGNHVVQYSGIAPKIVILNQNAACEHKAKLSGCVPGTKNAFVFSEISAFGTQTMQHFFRFSRLDAAKQCAFR